MRREECSHVSMTTTVTIVRWCVRCSGWRYTSLAESSAELSGTPSKWDVITNGFWHAECADPSDHLGFIGKILRVSQEREQDARMV